MLSLLTGNSQFALSASKENNEINPKNVRNSDNYRSERRAIAGRPFREILRSHRRGRGEWSTL